MNDGAVLFESDAKSSTESESDCKMKFSAFSSTETLIQYSFSNRDLLYNLEFSNTEKDKVLVLRMIAKSQLDYVDNRDLLKILQENLNNSNYEIFKITLEIYEKIINSSWETMKEVFINLLETLYVYYFSLSTDAHVDLYPFRNAFKIYELVLNTLNNICLHMSTISHSRLEKIIGNFVDLVFFTMNTNEYLTPLNIISCLDPKAVWCKIMLHSATSRSILFRCMKRNTNLLKYLFVVISEWIRNPFIPETNSICYSTIKYMTFLNSVLCCSYFSKFRSFYNLFPITIGSNFIVCLNSFIMSLIAFLTYRSKTPELIATCMVNCTVSLLQFQPTDYLVDRLQFITDILQDSKSKYHKYLLEIVNKLLQDKVVMKRIVNHVLYVKTISQSIKLLKRVDSTNNVFANLINIIKADLQDNNGSRVVQVYFIFADIFQCHELLIVCGLKSSILTLFELIGSNLVQRRLTDNCGDSADWNLW